MKTNTDAYYSSNQQEQTSMVWQCHEERGKFNTESCDEVRDEGKENMWKAKKDNIDGYLK